MVKGVGRPGVHQQYKGARPIRSSRTGRPVLIVRVTCLVCAAAENVFSATVSLAPSAPTPNLLRKDRTRREVLAITCLSRFHI